MKNIVIRAAEVRKEHFRIGMPMRSLAESFRESNIAHDMSSAFREAGFFVFPEFPVPDGSIDAVFVRNQEVVICEWKRFNNRAGQNVVDQTQRMLAFDSRELTRHYFNIPNPLISHLWVCDSWYKEDSDWWFGRDSEIQPSCPFDSTWDRGCYDFPELRPGWYSYRWLWAYHRNEKGA